VLWWLWLGDSAAYKKPAAICGPMTWVDIFWMDGCNVSDATAAIDNCPHQSRHTCQLSIIFDSCPTAVIIKAYHQSSHHPQHTCPPAIMQQLLWWVMLLSAQSHRHWLMLLMSATFLLNTAVYWLSIFNQEMTHAYVCIFSAELRLHCQHLLTQHIWQLHNFCWHCTLKIAKPQSLTHLLMKHIQSI